MEDSSSFHLTIDQKIFGLVEKTTEVIEQLDNASRSFEILRNTPEFYSLEGNDNLSRLISSSSCINPRNYVRHQFLHKDTIFSYFTRTTLVEALNEIRKSSNKLWKHIVFLSIPNYCANFDYLEIEENYQLILEESKKIVDGNNKTLLYLDLLTSEIVSQTSFMHSMVLTQGSPFDKLSWSIHQLPTYLIDRLKDMSPDYLYHIFNNLLDFLGLSEIQVDGLFNFFESDQSNNPPPVNPRIPIDINHQINPNERISAMDTWILYLLYVLQLRQIKGENYDLEDPNELEIDLNIGLNYPYDSTGHIKSFACFQNGARLTDDIISKLIEYYSVEIILTFFRHVYNGYKDPVDRKAAYYFIADLKESYMELKKGMAKEFFSHTQFPQVNTIKNVPKAFIELIKSDVYSAALLKQFPDEIIWEIAGCYILPNVEYDGRTKFASELGNVQKALDSAPELGPPKLRKISLSDIGVCNTIRRLRTLTDTKRKLTANEIDPFTFTPADVCPNIVSFGELLLSKSAKLGFEHREINVDIQIAEDPTHPSYKKRYENLRTQAKNHFIDSIDKLISQIEDPDFKAFAEQQSAKESQAVKAMETKMKDLSAIAMYNRELYHKALYRLFKNIILHPTDLAATTSNIKLPLSYEGLIQMILINSSSNFELGSYASDLIKEEKKFSHIDQLVQSFIYFSINLIKTIKSTYHFEIKENSCQDNGHGADGSYIDTPAFKYIKEYANIILKQILDESNDYEHYPLFEICESLNELYRIFPVKPDIDNRFYFIFSSATDAYNAIIYDIIGEKDYQHLLDFIFTVKNTIRELKLLASLENIYPYLIIAIKSGNNSEEEEEHLGQNEEEDFS